MNLYIGNLTAETSEADLRALFSEVGELVSVKIVENQHGQSRGFGFVEFESRKDGYTAITKFDGQMLHGSKLRVNAASIK